MRETSKFGNSNTPPIYPDPKPPSNIPVYKRFDRQKSKSQEAIAKVEENKFMQFNEDKAQSSCHKNNKNVYNE